jgi:hypothetical protein
MRHSAVTESPPNTRQYVRIVGDFVVGLAAETFCEDGFAKARRSDRMAGLRAMIDEHIVGRERRSRESG